MIKELVIPFTGGQAPVYATNEAAGGDLIADITDDLVIEPLERALIPTGLTIALPAGYEAQVRSRSGLALKHGLMVLNSPGTIDSDYRGEIKVIIANISKEPFTVNRGMRIAQLIIAPYLKADYRKVEPNELLASERGDAGFGSTGGGGH